MPLRLEENGWVLAKSLDGDVDRLMKWFADVESIKVWGGPGFRYPFTRHSFAEDCLWGRMASFSLRNKLGELAAFGQVCERYGRIHLARLVVDPEMRGKGIGKRLVGMLMTCGRDMFDCAEYSLFVFRDNQPAYQCYRSMGFEVVEYPPDAPLPGQTYYLTRPVGATSKMHNKNMKGDNDDQ